MKIITGGHSRVWCDISFEWIINELDLPINITKAGVPYKQTILLHEIVFIVFKPTEKNTCKHFVTLAKEEIIT